MEEEQVQSTKNLIMWHMFCSAGGELTIATKEEKLHGALFAVIEELERDGIIVIPSKDGVTIKARYI